MSQQKNLQTVPGWAVLVGINHYTDQYTHPSLHCCVRDAIGLYVLLTHQDHGNFAPEHVILLLDGTYNEVRVAATSVVQRLEKEYNFSVRSGMVDEVVKKRMFPEREDILAEIHRAAHDANPDDILLIHFAGHGHVFDGEMYLVPPRTRHPLYFWTAIPLKWVKECLHRSQARRKILLLDACYSGPPAATIVPMTNKQLDEILFPDTDDMAILTSCLPWERSFEQDDPPRNLLHGIFTLYLLEGLSGKADKEQKGYVTLEDLYRYVDAEVKTWVAVNVKLGPLQTPSMNRFSEQHGTSIIFSGGHNAAPADKEIAEIPFVEADETLPLEVRVWVESVSTSLTSVRRGLRPMPKRADAAFHVDERVRIGFSVSQDAYIYLLDVDTEGRVIQIFPNSVWRDNLTRKGQTNFIPREDDNFEIPVQGPSGVDTLIAIATTKSLQVFADWQTGIQTFPIHQRLITEQELASIAHVLSRLSHYEWAVVQYQFKVEQ